MTFWKIIKSNTDANSKRAKVSVLYRRSKQATTLMTPAESLCLETTTYRSRWCRINVTTKRAIKAIRTRKKIFSPLGEKDNLGRASQSRAKFNEAFSQFVMPAISKRKNTLSS